LGKGEKNTHRRPASREPSVGVTCTPCTPFDHFKLKMIHFNDVKMINE